MPQPQNRYSYPLGTFFGNSEYGHSGSQSPFFGDGGDYEEEGNEGESAPTVTYEDVQGHPAQYATGAEPAVSSTTHYDGHYEQGDGNVGQTKVLLWG